MRVPFRLFLNLRPVVMYVCIYRYVHMHVCYHPSFVSESEAYGDVCICMYVCIRTYMHVCSHRSFVPSLSFMVLYMYVGMCTCMMVILHKLFDLHCCAHMYIYIYIYA